MAMAVGGAGQTAVRSQPNVVPMIDIMLVLLIIFMIVTPLIAAGFKATLPKGKNLDPRPEGDNEVVLGIDEYGKYFLNGRPLPEGTLEDQLRAMYAGREDKIVYLKADQNLKYGQVQKGIEIARQAGARVVASITETKTAQKLFSGDEKKE
ncbi:MAG TPA: biopolymer transporter ExbD [Gemmatimonadales bacterium]|nr:biopolymer transporter ExbD [Gemmatimonadales bacterium]